MIAIAVIGARCPLRTVPCGSKVTLPSAQPTAVVAPNIARVVTCESVLVALISSPVLKLIKQAPELTQFLPVSFKKYLWFMTRISFSAATCIPSAVNTQFAVGAQTTPKTRCGKYRL